MDGSSHESCAQTPCSPKSRGERAQHRRRYLATIGSEAVTQCEWIGKERRNPIEDREDFERHGGNRGEARRGEEIEIYRVFISPAKVQIKELGRAQHKTQLPKIVSLIEVFLIFRYYFGPIDRSYDHYKKN